MHRVIFAAAVIVFIVVVFFLIYQQSGIESARKGKTPGGGQPGTSDKNCVPAASYSPHRAAAHSQQHSGTQRSGYI